MDTLKTNTIIHDRIYKAGTPLDELPEAARGTLVETMVVRAARKKADAPSATDLPPAGDLGRLRLAELQQLGAARGVTMPEDATRHEWIDALEATRGA